MKKSLVALTTGMMLALTACGLAPQVNAKAPENDADGMYDYTLLALADAIKSNLTDKEFEDMGYSPDYKDAVKQSENHKQLTFKPLDEIIPIDFSKVDISKYDTFTQIVNDLKPGMGYANATLDGTDVLLVSTGCYDWDGISAAIDSYVFMYNKDGAVVYLGALQSGGTANPLVMYDGKIITATHHTVAKNTVKNGKLVVVEEASETFDTDGNATYYVGSKKVNDDTKLSEMFKEAMEGEIINFQVKG
ncbi:MAG: hypothetical protein K6F75_05120 [Butyrivibrio sp.]|nr:hypothetical protein [Butyrivibrio sp.]